MASKGRKLRVCLFGTSANPPTGKGGHVGIARHLASIESSKRGVTVFDEVRVLPVYSHVFNSKQNLETFDHRLAMCKIAFDGIDNVTVSDDERTLFNRIASRKGITSEEEKKDLKVGTADLIDMLLEDSQEGSEDEIEITLALGADTFMSLTEWKWMRSEDIFRSICGRIIVLARKSLENTITEDELSHRIKEVQQKFTSDGDVNRENIRMLYIPTLTAVSSSAIRKTKRTNELIPGVSDYIKEHNLYAFSSKSQFCENDNKQKATER